MMVMATTFNLLAADALVDDCNGSTNQNKFGQYWYMYDDNKDGGSSKLSNGTITVIKSGTDYVVAPTAGAGNTGGGIVLPYTLGPTPCTAGAWNYVGLGTMLCDSAKTSSCDLTGATMVTFYLKASVAIQVDFAVLTKEVIEPGASYHILESATTTWTKCSVLLSSTGIGALSQPSWTKTPLAFNIKSVQKLQWQVHSDNVGTNKTGIVYVDDIYITNYTFVPFDLAPATCIGTPGQTPSPAALLSNMDTPIYNQNARTYYWYCYNDGAGRTPTVTAQSQFSAITAGATVNAIDPTAAPLISIGPTATSGSHGYGATGYGADIQFTLGPVFNKVQGDGVPIRPFVGIGTGLWYETTTSNLYNAQADNVTGVYFDYMLSGGTASTYARLEVYDATVLGSGVVHYINLPATGANTWKGASILFSQLVLPHWSGVVTTTPLDKTKLEKLQWAVQDDAGTIGELAIDNVYLLNATTITKPSTIGAVKFQNNPVKEMNGISTSIVSNYLKVSFSKEMSNASVTLVNTKGSVVAKSISGVSQTAQLNVAGLASGVYMLNVKAIKSGSEFNKTMPVTVY
jgi:Protein of unknown function (DUF3244)./Carbohydrate binding domain (family 11).